MKHPGYPANDMIYPNYLINPEDRIHQLNLRADAIVDEIEAAEKLGKHDMVEAGKLELAETHMEIKGWEKVAHYNEIVNAKHRFKGMRRTTMNIGQQKLTLTESQRDKGIIVQINGREEYFEGITSEKAPIDILHKWLTKTEDEIYNFIHP